MPERLTSAGVLLLLSCSEPAPPMMITGPDDPLLDPAMCAECHPAHYDEWLGSMHAYAANDPVFLAMNARGQRETEGELGDFCVQCHAPMAVALGLTEDGLDLDAIPQKFKGVTCYFCHSVETVAGTHNNPLRLAMDGTMRGAIEDPVGNDAHASAYSTTFFSDADPLSGGPAVYGLRCGTCHMVDAAGHTEVGPIADAPGVRGDRIRHPHQMAAVDVVLDDFPGGALTSTLAAAQRASIDYFRLNSTCAEICVNHDGSGGSIVDIYLHNEFAAHSFPSGATQDRRVWLELHVYAGDTELLGSGAVPEGVAVDTVEDPLLWSFGSRMYDDAGAEVHMFWEAQRIEENLLLGAETLSAFGDASRTWQARRYPVPGIVDRVTTALHIQPMSLAVLDDLIASGDLDPAIRSAMPTFTTPPSILEWTPARAFRVEGYGDCLPSNPDNCGASLAGADIPD